MFDVWSVSVFEKRFEYREAVAEDGYAVAECDPGITGGSCDYGFVVVDVHRWSGYKAFHLWISFKRVTKGRAIKRVEQIYYMSDNKYEFTLKMLLAWLDKLESAMDKYIRYRAEEHDEVSDEAKILSLLEDVGAPIRLKQEQSELEEQIKDLETRRNDLWT